MEIKVGEYIRTKDGYIGKVQKLKPDCEYNQNYLICEKDNMMASDYTENIAKHSPNIIGLIEEGDIIEYKSEQGYDNIIEEVWKVENNNVLTIDGTRINIERVVSIVTKEQFNQMKYIVGGE